ncbi:MAG: InlB B-repeat-containing protein, partial [Treponema sp.]
MKKSFFAVIPALLFASCSFWNEPVEEFFSYWTSEAYVTDSSVKVPNQSDSEGIISVASDKNAEVILNIANPKNFNLVMPSAGNTEMIHFNAFDPQPVFGADYMIEKLSSKALKLTYTAQFLKKHEWGQKDLGASITMFADDGREFKKNYTFKIKSNTKPPQPSVILAQTNESTPHYVLCLTVPDMDAQVNGKKLHKDIAQIVINESSYELKINDSGSDFVKPTDESFITRTDAAQLTTPGAEAVPTGNWTLFYKTDREVGSAYKEYTVTLKDQKGLSSEKLETGTTINKPAEETVLLNTGTQESGSGTNALPFIIQAAGSKPEAQLIISCTSSGTTVHCTVTDVSTGTSSEYNGNPANVPLGLNGENEKLYEVKYNTKGYGYNPTTLKTKYYKILKLHTVTFNANGGKFADDSTAKTESVLHGRTVTAPSASPTRVGNVFVGWYKEEDGTTEWNFTDDTIRSNTIIYAKWSDKAVEIKSDEDGAWKKLKEEAAKTSGISVIVIDGEIKATTDSGNSGEITIGRNLTIQGKTGAASDKLDANGNVLGHSNSHRIFKVTGGKTLTLKNLTLKGGRAEKSDSSSPLNASGGSILLESGTVSLSHVTVSDCKAITTAGNSGQGGGIYVKSGTLTINNSMLSANEASKSGGAIYADAGTTVELDICTIQNCKASDGGAIYNDKGSLTIKGASKIKVNEATNNGGAFLIKGGSPNGSLHMENNCIVEQNKAKKGGGIYITDSGTAKILFCRVSQNEAQDGGGSVYIANGTFTIGGSTLITPSTAGETNQKGKNDVYLANGQKITIDDTLTGTHPVARITPATYNKTTQVLGGTPALLGSEHTKFTVTQKDNEKWGVSEQGKLALMEAAIDADASPADAWKKFKEAVKAAGDGAVITVKGEIKATNATDNSGEIVIDNNLTVKKADGATSAVLNANKDGANAPATTHRIFKVASGKTLTLENLTIKGGKPDGSDEGGNGGGILLQGGALNMKNCDVKGNEAAGAGGGIYIDTGCSLTMKDNAKVTGNESSTSGGGIHAENGSTLVIEHCSVTANTASGSGGGIHAGGALTVDSCAITDNKTTGDSGGGAYVSGTAEIKGSTTIAHNEADVSGGGIYVSNGTLRISNATVGGEQDYDDTDPNKANGNKAVTGGGIYAINSTLTMTDCMLPYNAAKGSSSVFGGGIYAEGGTIDMTRCQLSANKSKGGGGMYAKNTTLTMTTCQLDDNDAGSGSGGGAYAEGGSFALSGSTMSGNATGDSGGGAYIKDCAFTMTDSTLTGNTAQYNGGGAYVAGGSFTMKGSSRIIPSSAGEENQPGKNEVYLDNGAKITLPAVLTGTGTAARITVAHNKYLSTTQVLDGSKVVTEYGKFTVTPKSLGGGSTQVWTINNTGHLQKPPVTINGADSDAWKKLKAAVAAADDGDIFIINGEVKATNATDNSGELEVNKDITVKKALSASTAVLNANSRHSGTAPADAPATKHRIFKVTSGKTLTLQNLTLKGGIAETSGDALGGGISVINGGKVTLKNTAIRDCQAQYGGAVNVKGSSSSVTMESGSLTANTATTIGGAVNVDNGASFTMTGGEITGNTGKSGGGGAYVHEGTFTLGTGALITSNTAEGRNGGGVYVDSGGTLTINGGAIKSNKATKSGSAVGNGGGVYVFGNTVSKGKVRMTAGEISGNAAGLDGTAYIGDGGGVYNEGGTVEISGGEVKGNNANYGGGVYAKDGTVNITGGVIGGANAADANKATGTSSGEGMGGGIYVSNCTVTLKDGVQVIGNTAKYGGGVYASGGSLVITSSTIGKCQATQEGGGIFAKGGSVELNSCT